jgi:hypothetical protein
MKSSVEWSWLAVLHWALGALEEKRRERMVSQANKITSEARIDIAKPTTRGV